MVRILVMVILATSFSAWAKSEAADQPTKFEITPLDSETERILKESPLAKHVTEFDAEHITFRKKTILAHRKIKPMISLKKHDSLDFVYDSIFLTEKGFFTKYKDLSKTKLAKARNTVIETFEK